MSKGFASSYRIVLLATGLFVGFGGVAVRLVWLHVVDREALVKTITKSRLQYISEVARRGDIVDARGGLLATSSTHRVLGVDPMSLRPQDQKSWPELAAMIGVPLPELRRIFLTKYRAPVAPTPASAASAATKAAGLVINLGTAPAAAQPAAATEETDTDIVLDGTPDEKGRIPVKWVKLKEDVPDKLYEEIMKLGIKGVYSIHTARRAYPNKHLAAHVLGYVNRQQESVSGMEKYADFYLKGQDGWRVGERDGRNRELPQFLDRRIPPSDGYSVKLSIDTIVQDIVEQELAYLGAQYEPKKISIIVSEPKTGFILAMGNYPTFDPNEYNKVPHDEMHRMKNVAVTDIYEPGSVFKIVAVAAALEERIANVHSTFDCTTERIVNRGISVDMPSEDHRFANPRVVSMGEVVSYSSNRGAGQLAVALGEDRFNKYVRAFGFGAKLGFPVGPEVSGLLKPVTVVNARGKEARNWHPIDITRIAIGHSVSATVLQMHQAMSVIANDGVLLLPQVIREVRDATGEVVFRYDSTQVGRVVSTETARTVAQLLKGVASKNGTALEAAIEGYDVAGKTGTTIKLMDVKRADGTTTQVYDNRHHIASFVGFFPAHRPQVAISVIVDDADHKAPNGVAYGGRIAAPSFKRIAERLIPILNIQAHSQTAPVVAANQGGRR